MSRFRLSIYIYMLAAVWTPPSFAAAPNLWRVVVPVADLRSEPKDAPKDTYAHDPLQESQLLFGERVRVHETKGEWALVEGIEQDEFTHKKKWEGYPGWVRAAALERDGDAADVAPNGVVRRLWAAVYSGESRRSSILANIPIGSLVRILREKSDRTEIVYRGGKSAWMSKRDIERLSAGPSDLPTENILGAEVWTTARRFLGVPYYWGGMSMYQKNFRDAVTGVDCSGLTHLCYRAAGIRIPRDSHEQWMSASPVQRSSLRRGDLVFLANSEKPERVVHVMMYAGGEFLIEGPGTGQRVRRVTFKKKLGQRLSLTESGDTVGPKVVYFGRPAIRPFVPSFIDR